jgi:hypothetical protein
MGGSISPRMSVYIGKSHRGVNRANVNHPSAFRSVNPCVSIHRFRMVKIGCCLQGLALIECNLKRDSTD